MLMKKLIQGALSVVLFILAACGGGDEGTVVSRVGLEDGTSAGFTIRIATKETLYVYNYPHKKGIPTQPVTLAPSGTLRLPFKTNPEMRVYFDDRALSNTIEKGKAPDPFNYYSDATAKYSFVEYLYETCLPATLAA